MEKYSDSYWNVGDRFGVSVEHYSSIARGVAVKAINGLGRWSVFAAVALALSASLASDQLAYEAGKRSAAKNSVTVNDPVAAKIIEAQLIAMQRNADNGAER